MCTASLMKVMHLFCILFKAINLFFVGQKLLSKNAICLRMNLSQMSKLSLAAEYKKYIVQTFEPCVKQRFAPKLAVCYWLYNVNLIKNPKLFIILVWRGGSTSSEGVPQLQRLDEAALCYEHHTWKVYKLKGKTPLAALFKLM